MNTILGIDEAGRGPLAGPVAVGLVKVAADIDLCGEFFGLNDSKKLTERTRERIYEQALLMTKKEDSVLEYRVEFGTAREIDEEGIAVVIHRLIKNGLEKLHPDILTAKVYLDGSLEAPAPYVQEIIIGGDALIPSIMLASVMAKVERDRLMVEFANTYPQYGFEKHKGYGTKLHMQMIREYGLSAIHRNSFIHLD